MADEAGFRIARAFVEVAPDMADFKEKVRAGVDEALAGVEGKARVGLDDRDLQARAEQAKAAVRDVGRQEGTAKATLDDSDLRARAEQSRAAVRDVGRERADPKLGADDSDAKAKIEDLRTELDRLRAVRAGATLDADATPAEVTIARLEAQIKDLRGQVRMDADTAPARAEIDHLEMKLRVLQLERKGVTVDADIGPAELKIAELKAQIDSLSSGAGAAGGGGGFSPLGMLTAGPWGGTLGIGSMIGVAGALIPSLGGGLAGLGGTAGAGALAYSGVSTAMQDYMALQQQKQSGAFAAQQAQVSFANSVQIQQAQQQIAAAHANAAQVAISSANAIAQSQMSLAMTERNAAASDIQAQQSVVQAQQQLQSANFGLASAQYSLSEAWIQARYNLIQLNDQLHNQSTSLAAAQLAVQQAQYQQQLTDQNAMSTSLDRQQAALAVVQAQEQLTAVQQQGTYIQQQAALQDKAGVAGSQQVVSAQQAVRQALYGVTDARMAYADAVRNLTNTQLNNASQVKAAQMAVTMAEEQAAFQQQQAALATQQAQQNLTNTIRAQQLQYAASGNAALTFARDMGMLSGPQQQIVRGFETFNGVLQDMQAAAAKAMLPGVTAFFQGLHAFLPSVMSAISQFGGAASAILRELGQALASKSFQAGFASLVTQGVTFMRLLEPMGTMLRNLFGLWARGAPASAGLARMLAAVASGFSAMFRALGPVVAPAGQLLTALGRALGGILGALGQFMAGFIRGLAPALAALMPGLLRFLDALGAGLGTALAGLGPGLTAVGGAISATLAALAPLLPVLGQLIAAGAQALVPMLTAVAKNMGPLATIVEQALRPALAGLIPMLAPLGQLLGDQEQVLIGILGITLPLIPALVKLAAAFLPLLTDLLKLGVVLAGPLVAALDIAAKGLTWVTTLIARWITDAANWIASWTSFSVSLGGIWKGIENAALWMWHNVFDPMWRGLKTGADWVYNNAILPLWHGIQTVFGLIRTAVSILWHQVFDPLWGGIETGARGFIAAFGTIWGTIKSTFAGPVDFLINTVYDKGIAWLWNEVVTHIGLGNLKLPTLTASFAGGGVVPGTDHGRDERLAMVRPQEGILVPEAVAGIGGPAVIHALNRRFGGRASAGPGYGGGGIIGDIGGFFSAGWHDVTSAFGDVVAIGKLAAAVVTGNTTAFVNAASRYISTKAAGDLAQVMVGLPKTLVTDLAREIVSSVSSVFGGGGGGGGVGAPGPHGGIGGGVQQYAQIVLQVLRMLGQPAGDLGTVLAQMTTESGGNATIVNRWDSNWAAGTPSVGLMQVIGPTFASYAGPFRTRGPFEYGVSVDPEANIYAGLNYAIHRYGAGWTGVLGQGHGYDSGGVLPPGLTLMANQTGRPEAVLTPDQWQLLRQIAERAARNGGAAAPAPVASFNYFGPQAPTPEMQASMMRDLALAFGGP